MIILGMFAMMKSMRKLFWVIGVIAVCFFVYTTWSRLQLRPLDPNDQTNVIFEIPSGSSVKQIGEDLEEKGIIRSGSAFVSYVKSKDLQTGIKAGSYLLRPSMGVAEIAGILARGFSGDMAVTIPEGFTIAQIDKLLADKQMLKEGEFIACAKTCDFSKYTFLPKNVPASAPGGRVEGYLYPDTYFVVREGLTAEGLIKRLLDTFERRVIDALEEEMLASKRTIHDLISMASLVEEETRTDEERPMVSGILWKRYDAGMRLDVDAAVRYALGKQTAPITVTDLQSDSPYNLRKIRGLPPTPIANPGLKSIQAAIKPVESPYWFYLHGNDGVIRYAVTNDEHNENRSKYLK